MNSLEEALRLGETTLEELKLEVKAHGVVDIIEEMIAVGVSTCERRISSIARRNGLQLDGTGLFQALSSPLRRELLRQFKGR